MPWPERQPIEDPNWPVGQYRDKPEIDPMPLIDLNPIVPDCCQSTIDKVVESHMQEKDGDDYIRGFVEWRLGHVITEGIDFLEDQDIKYPMEGL